MHTDRMSLAKNNGEGAFVSRVRSQGWQGIAGGKSCIFPSQPHTLDRQRAIQVERCVMSYASWSQAFMSGGLNQPFDNVTPNDLLARSSRSLRSSPHPR